MTSTDTGRTVAISFVASDFATDAMKERIRRVAGSVADLLAAKGVSSLLVNAAAPDEDAAATVASVDGVLVLGGVDVDPAVYGEEPELEMFFLNDKADRYEASLVTTAAESDTPVLGICRGSQVINVAFGGSLVQDIPAGIHRLEGDPQDPISSWSNHDVSIEPDSRLASLLRETRLDGRSNHHQAVKRVGEGLRIVARADDGVVEGVEAEDAWVVGVQWHPEEAHADPEMFDRLLTGFVAAIDERK